MGAVGVITWGICRRALGGLLFVAALLGLGLAFSATALAGARRSDSAYDRLRATTLAPDAIVGADGLDDAAMARLAAARVVSGAARFTYTPVAPAPLRPARDAGALVGLDPDFLTRVYRPLVVSGRLPARGNPREVVVNEALARAAHLEPGRRVRLDAGFDRVHSLGHVTVVGIVRGTFDVGANAGGASMLLSKDFLDAHRARLELGPQPAALFRLRDPGRDLAALRRALERAVGHPVTTLTTSANTDAVDRFLAVQTIGLLVLAGAAFLAVLVASQQALGRQLDRAFVDLPILVACGLRPRQRYAVAAAFATIVVLLGGVIAVIGSVLASPLVPTGFARTVDPTTGIQLDPVAVGSVVAAAFVLMVALALVSAHRHRVSPSVAARHAHETRVGRGLPLIPRLGLQAALAPTRAPAGAAARSALVATASAVAGVVAVMTFGASLDRLLTQPRLQGWSFDVAISREGDATRAFERELAGLDDEPGIAGHAVAGIVEVDAGHTRLEAYAFDRAGLRLHPSMRSGRRPRADDEMVAGEDALARAGLAVGDSMVVRGPKGRARLRIVGTAAYPELGNQSDIATGVSITRATARRIGAVPIGTLALVRFDAPSGRRSLAARHLDGELVAAFRPPRVRSLEEVGGMPTVLAAFLGALGLLAVVHALRRSSRERRHDFALLATLGVVRSGLRRVIAWQSGAVAGTGLVVGIPAGLLVGRAAWSAVADATGVVDELAVPPGGIALLAASTVVLCLGIGIVSARQAIRPTPAATLRQA